MCSLGLHFKKDKELLKSIQQFATHMAALINTLSPTTLTKLKIFIWVLLFAL